MSRTRTEELILLKDVCADEAVAAFTEAAERGSAAAYARAYALLLAEDAENSFAAYLARKVLFDDNLFARRAFSGTLTPHLIQAYRRDLGILQSLASFADRPPEELAPTEKDPLPAMRSGTDDALFGSDWASEETAERLEAFYRKNGFGMFIANKAFTLADGALRPVRNTSAITLSDLKDYEDEKRAVENNVINFVKGLPYSDMLLYGDKGTGKSSTVHAVLNKYAEQGLRAVELQKDQLAEINAVKELLSALPFHFLLFIDDLSLEEKDEKVTSLKASLEGSMNEKSANVMIVATSNRRHILKENFSDRDNSVHASDTMEEQLSLSDRFGLTVRFSSTGKREYLSIVTHLAHDMKLKIGDEELCALAERWAIVKGGRSPRRARQFADFVYASLAENREIDF